MDKANQDAVLPETHCEVLIVGGGPAGSTIAALLAERGFDTALVEKDRHPRFHIGKSLLPLNLPLLDRLGVLKQIERIGMLKLGAEFVSPYHSKSVSFYFAMIGDVSLDHAYQVRRSEFDHILIENAKAKGAVVTEGFRIAHLQFLSEGGVVATGRAPNGEARRWRAKFIVDASGRDTLIASQLKIKHRNPKHNSAALYGHFTGAKRQAGKAEGNISIFWFEHGWFWLIPLSDGTTSVGAVCWPAYIKSRKCDFDTFFLNTIALCPELADRLNEAHLVAPVTGTGNYSYQAEQMTGNSYIIIGDAFAFVDPIFSTGVYLAMNGAFVAADTVETCLCDPEHASRALRNFEVQIRRGLKTISWYIYRITRPAMRDLLMSPSNIFGVEQALLSLLAGDFYRRSTTHSRLRLFKLFYYIANMRAPVATYQAWEKHRRDVRTSPD